MGGISLRSRLLLLLSLAILPLAALVGHLLWLEHDQTLDLAKVRLLDAAKLAASDQSSVFDEARTTLDALGAVSMIRTPGGFAECSALAASLKKGNANFNTVGAFNAEGMVTCHSQSKKSQAFGDRELLERARASAGDAFLVGHFIIGKASGRPTVVTLKPLHTADGAFAGAVFVSLDLEHLSVAAQTLSDGGRRVVVMIEPASSRMLTRYPPFSIPYGTAFPQHPLVRAMRQAPSGGVVEAPGLDNVERIFGFAPLRGVEDAGIMLAVGELREPLMAPVRTHLVVSLSFLGAVILLASLAMWWLGYWTHLRPIQRLRKTAEQIGAGDLEARATLEAWQAPELRLFGQRLEEMALKLGEGRKAEEAVAESHRYLKIAERLAKVGYWQIDPRSGRCNWSDEVFRIHDFPITAEPPSFDECVAVIHEDDRHTIRSAFGGAIGQGIEFDIQHRVVHAGGEIRHVFSRACVEKDEDGAVSLVFGVIMDVTAAKTAERDLKAKSALLEATLDTIDQGLVMIGTDGRLDVSNRRFAELLDLPADLFREPRPSFEDILAHLDERGEFADVDPAFRQHIQTPGAPLTLGTYERRRANGRILEVRTVLLPHGDGVVRTYTDVTERRAAESGLKESEQRYRMLVENASDMIFRLDRNLLRTYVSPASMDILGYAPEELVGHRPVDMLHPDEVEHVTGLYAQILGGLERADVTNRIRHKSGHWVWAEAELNALRDPVTNEVVAILGALRDVSDRKEAEERLAEGEARFRMLAENTADLVTHIDATGKRIFASPAALDLLGYAPEDLIGGRPLDLAYPDDRPALGEMLDRLAGGEQSEPVQYRALRKDGDYRWIEASGRPLGPEKGYILALRDIDRRKQVEDELELAIVRLNSLANSDGLTGLANRRRFDETLEREIARAARDRSPITLLLADVDHFKAYNDTYGHPAGDACLRKVADILADVIQRPGDLAARYGGEEFAAILPETDERGALTVSERLRTAVADARLEHSRSATGGLTISVGIITIVPQPGMTKPSHLIEAADSALYAAKGSGRNCIRQFRASELELARAG